MLSKIKYGIVGVSGRLGSEVKNVFTENGNELVFSYSLDGEWKTDIPKVIIDCSLPDVLGKTISYAKGILFPSYNCNNRFITGSIRVIKRIK